MQRKTAYLALCFLGAALPYGQFIPWLTENGVNLRLFFDQLFANRIGAFFAFDVIVSALVLLVFISYEARQLSPLARWLSVLALLTVGVSLALPLLLYFRERKLDQKQAMASGG